jgi:hypothetical protein
MSEPLRQFPPDGDGSLAEAAREANDRIVEKARRLRFTARVPFVCECGDPECRDFVLLRADELERARADGPGAVMLPEHRTAPPRTQH